MGIPLPESSSPGERIRWVLDHFFGGSQREMSRVLGVPQATISRVVRGSQEPGRKLLVSVGAYPKVNKTWLLTGEGEPLATAAEPEVAPTGCSLPISASILPGKPSEHVLKLIGPQFPVAVEHFGAERYWLKYSASLPKVGGSTKATLAGDLLLMEADPIFWSSAEKDLIGWLCALRIPSESGSDFVLAKYGIDFEFGGREYHFPKPRLELEPRTRRIILEDEPLSKSKIFLSKSCVISVRILSIRI